MTAAARLRQLSSALADGALLLLLVLLLPVAIVLVGLPVAAGVRLVLKLASML